MELTVLSDFEKRIKIDVSPRLTKRFHKKLKKSGANVSDDVVGEQLVRFSIEESIKRFEINCIWGTIPTPGSDKPIFRLNHNFCFSIDIDDTPEVKWPEFSSIKVTRPIRNIDDQMIEIEMQEQCRIMGIQNPIERDFQEGDILNCNVTLTEQGDASLLYTVENVEIKIPAAGKEILLFNIAIPSNDSFFNGISIGDSRTIEVITPNDYEDFTMQGVPVEIKIDFVKAIRIDPAQIDEVLQQYDSPSEGILRKQIKMGLESQATRDQTAELHQQIYQILLDSIDIPIPNWIIAKVTQTANKQLASLLLNRGCPEGTIRERIEAHLERSKQNAIALAKKRAITKLLVSTLKVGVNETEIIAQIATLAEGQGRRPEDVRQELIDQGKMGELLMPIYERLIVNQLLEEISITDVDVGTVTKSN